MYRDMIAASPVALKTTNASEATIVGRIAEASRPSGGTAPPKKRDRMDRAAYDRAMRAYHAIIDTGG